MLSRKKKNGFTLIELLVVIALMISILGIAIVSFINISNKKKQEAWEDVKAQIETAATEYFTANKYLFEGYDSTADAYISVGKLVEEDYINKVTNPVTGKALDYCTKVKVEKKGNKLDATYDGNVVSSGACDGNYMVTVSEPGAPIGETKYYDEDDNEKTADNTGWFNVSRLGDGRQLKLCITNVKANGVLKEVIIGGESIKKDGNGNYCRSYSNGKFNDVILKLKNQKGQWTQYVSFNVDTEKPIVDSFTVVSSTEGYNGKYVIPSFNVKDDYSGVDTSNMNLEENYGGSTEWVWTTAAYKEWHEHIVATQTEDWADGYKRYVLDIIPVKFFNEYHNFEYQFDVYVYDNAGNVSNKASVDYTTYKICQQTIRDAEGYYTIPGDTYCEGTIKKQYYTQGIYDALTGNSCGTGNTMSIVIGNCDVSNRCDQTYNGNEAKAYKWTEVDGDTNHCQQDNTLTMHKVSGETFSITGPYRKYAFRELQCNCKVSKTDNKSCGYTSYKDITKYTHYYNNGYYSYIIYNNDKKGENSCSDGDKNINTNVQRICINGEITDKGEYHGWYWYSNNPSSRYSKDTEAFQSGWYVSGSKKQIYPSNKSEKYICEKACESEY